MPKPHAVEYRDRRAPGDAERVADAEPEHVERVAREHHRQFERTAFAIGIGSNRPYGTAGAILERRPVAVRTAYTIQAPGLLTITARLQLGGYATNIGTYIRPDGAVDYTASGSTFLYSGSFGAAEPRTVVLLRR